jgi:hypothetical protein
MSPVLKVLRQCPLVLLLEVVNMIEVICITLEELHYSEIRSHIGRAACEACSATWNLVSISEFALGPRKPRETLIQ